MCLLLVRRTSTTSTAVSVLGAVCVCVLLQVWVIRTLRHRADLPNVKAGKAIPMVSLQEMQAQNAFINMSFGSDVNEVARMLREE